MDGHKSQSGLTPRQRRANSATVGFRPDGAAELPRRAANQCPFVSADNPLAPLGRKEDKYHPLSTGPPRQPADLRFRVGPQAAASLHPWLHPAAPLGRKTALAKGAVPFSRFCEKGTVPFAMPDDGERRKRQGNKSRLCTASVIGGWHGHAPLRDHVAVTRQASFGAHGHATARDHATRACHRN